MTYLWYNSGSHTNHLRKLQQFWVWCMRCLCLKICTFENAISLKICHVFCIWRSSIPWNCNKFPTVRYNWTRYKNCMMKGRIFQKIITLTSMYLYIGKSVLGNAKLTDRPFWGHQSFKNLTEGGKTAGRCTGSDTINFALRAEAVIGQINAHQSVSSRNLQIVIM